jgi:putative ABC transport system permease protein
MSASARFTRLPFLLRYALRDLGAGLRGFGIFLACIALGVVAITAVGSTSRALSEGLAREGRVILGGDASFAVAHRELSPSERAFLDRNGKVSSVALMRAMARRDDGSSALVEIKAVEPDYPATGAVVLDPPTPLGQALATRDGIAGVVADAALPARLGLKVGDELQIGAQRLRLSAILVSEPDKLAGGVGFGPRVLMSQQAFRATGLIQPGSLVRWLYRVALTGGPAGAEPDLARVESFVAAAQTAFPDAGWEARTRANISPQFSRNLDRFTQFLTLVGLTALIVGGVGVANAVRGFVERKKPDFATLKSVGATGAYVFTLSLVEVMLAAVVGVALGAALGAAAPWLIVSAFGAAIPFPLAPAIYPGEIVKGFLYGLAIALVFALTPLGRAHDVPVSALFRDAVEPDGRRVRARYLIAAAVAGGLLVASLFVFTTDKRLTAIYLVATLAGYALLRLVALGLMAAARRLPHPRHVGLRLAIGNIHRPGALTPAVVISLGLGLALLVSLTLIDGNIRNQLREALPGQTPSFFFVDIQSAQAKAFDDFLRAQAPDARLETVPMMRGRITRVKDERAENVSAKENAAWVLEGDRGITFAEKVPDGSRLAAGEWWPLDYKGPPLVSMEAEIADGLGLRIGDSISVNVLGRTITARIANLRTVNWRSFGINFVLVFSPNTFAGAPHTSLATVTFPRATEPARELRLLAEAARAFPAVTSVRVKDALDAANAIVAQLAVAVRGASGVALIASVLVLAGALAAGQRSRIYDSVVLKTLGATRGRLLGALVMEYALLGAATGLFAVLAGAGAAQAVVTKVMKLDFVWLWPQTLAAAGAALALTIALGLLGTWRVLGQRPASHLRDL